jgi:mannose-6-phosphate isomerase-like protein (cupin superfamily)
MAFVTNIEDETLNNVYYRNVLFTTPQLQLVVMKLYPEEDISLEEHEGSQFIRVESGRMYVWVNEEEYILEDDEIIIISAFTPHYIKNVGDDVLAIYTLYSPPEHPPDTVEWNGSI